MMDSSVSMPKLDKKDTKKWEKSIKEIAKGEKNLVEARKDLSKAEEKAAKITRELRDAQGKVADANSDIRKEQNRINDARMDMDRLRRGAEQSYRGTDVNEPLGTSTRPIAPSGTVTAEEAQ